MFIASPTGVHVNKQHFPAFRTKPWAMDILINGHEAIHIPWIWRFLILPYYFLWNVSSKFRKYAETPALEFQVEYAMKTYGNDTRPAVKRYLAEGLAEDMKIDLVRYGLAPGWAEARAWVRAEQDKHR